MRIKTKFAAWCFTGRASKRNRKSNRLDQLSEAANMENQEMKEASAAHQEDVSDNSKQQMTDPEQQLQEANTISDPETVKENMGESSSANIIVNHNFSNGLSSWLANCCEAIVVQDGSEAEGYVVVSNRTECWQGLEQDITTRVSPGSSYLVSACVGVSEGSCDVKATLKLENRDLATKYLFLGKASVSKGKREKLEASFTLSSMHDRVVFYLEGPFPGVDLLIYSVTIHCVSKIVNENTEESRSTNIIVNNDFSNGLSSWHTNCCACEALVVSGGSEAAAFAVVTNRMECWHGLEQDITTRVSPGSSYSVSACVGVSEGSCDVTATLKLGDRDSATEYLFLGKTSVSKGNREKLEASFTLSSMHDRVVFYLEGPSPGVDLLIHSVNIHCVSKKSMRKECLVSGDGNIILNPDFADGSSNWSGRSCKIVLHDSMANGRIVPQSGNFFACATERTQSWNGIQQEITGKVQRKLVYGATAVVRIFGNNVTSATVQATLWVQTPNSREQYVVITNVQATDKDWIELHGKFLLNATPSRVIIYLEGPPPGTDILINSLVVKHAEKVAPSPTPIIQNPAFGINVIANSRLSASTNGWFPLGNCTLSVGNGSPLIVPPMAKESLGVYEPLSGRYILVTNRTQNWMGPAQMITEKIKLFLTYQVSAWVRLGSGAQGSQNVNVALGVDSQWVNGGQVEISDDRWHEIGGSFRIEKQPSKVMVYIQGPASGVDFMVAGLQIFPVDRVMRFKYLKREADKIRKRDVILKFSGGDSKILAGTSVIVKQTQNSFPLGTCISRTNMDNEDFVDFFVNNFNWAVFGNELKWYWTESQQGNFNYQDADDMLDLCKSNNIQVRGHCIFWEVESTVQNWIRQLDKTAMMNAVQNRLTGLLTRYKGQFSHYDVNNEMLHGSFYQDHLGKDIRANMFKTANKLDPSALLFVNDYHVEDGCDPKSCPEKYIQHIMDLQEQGAAVGGIGIQGHIDNPVGPIVSSALDKLGTLGLPIWFTELDVSSTNEHVRGEDLEVMLWEAFAHPAVEGIMLWGFWEQFMSRDNAHLVNAEGEINETGKRFLAVRRSWLTRTHGVVDEQGEFAFRGYHGMYTVQIVTPTKKTVQSFVVDKGDSPLVVSIDL